MPVRSVDQVGMRLGADRLEALARLAEGRRMEQVARVAGREVTRGRRARFLTSNSRFIFGASRWGGRKTGPNPTDRSRPGSKHHILVDAKDVPISAILTGANRNDATQLLPLVDAIPPIRGVRPTASEAKSHLRRPWLRLRAASSTASRAWYQTGDLQAPHRTRQRTGQIPLGDRAYSRMAPQLSSSSYSL
ncbi:hypothetical protein QF001_003087 [Paraburkholderia youngii]